MAFVERKLKFTIKLAPETGTNQPNTFTGSGTDTVTIQGLRASVRINNSGVPVGSSAQVKIFGMPPSLMNQLATLGLAFNLVPKNVITIMAGDDESGFSSVFLGTVWAAYGDYSAQPSVPFHFECLAGAADAAITIPASSFTGSTDVATIMSGLARQMNMGFENNGISIKLSSPYLVGSAIQQVRKTAEQAGIEWTIEGNKLCIWPKGGNRSTPSVPVISPDTGMIGYPAFTKTGIIVRTVFNPQISFGSLVRVDSSLLSGIAAAQPTRTLSTGVTTPTFPTQWSVNKIDHVLDQLTPSGEWASTIYAYSPGKVTLPPNSGTNLGNG
jgi:hypothetical protein